MRPQAILYIAEAFDLQNECSLHGMHHSDLFKWTKVNLTI